VLKAIADEPGGALRVIDAGDFIERMELLRSLRPGGWWPQVEFANPAALKAASATGHGAIVWVTPTLSSAVVSKLALRNERYDVTHLSAPDHGPSDSRLGGMLLNRLHVRVEERLVRERVVMPRGEAPVEAVQYLRRRLEANGVVTITVAPGGLQQARVPLYDRILEVPTGAPALARAAGAALIPAFVERVAPARYRFRLGPPIVPDATIPRDEALWLATRAYARQLEDFVREHPALWRGWRYPMVTTVQSFER
jgi:hypothetical protein